MVLPSLATPAPGMLLLQHKCQRRARVCVHRSWGFPSSLCLALWGNYAPSSAQGLSPFPSLLVFPHAPLDFPKKSPCPTTLGCCPSLVPAAASQGKPSGRGEARAIPYREQSVWLSRSFPTPAARLHAAAVAAGRGGSRARSGGFGPVPPAAQADSSGSGSARGGMWLPGRLVYCAGNKGAVVPGLLKCLGARPLPSAGGWSTLGSRPGGGTLLRNASFLNSLLFGVGLAPPSRLSAEGRAMPHCPPTAACVPLSGALRGGGSLLSPQKEPPCRCQALPTALLQGVGLVGFLTAPLWQCRGLGGPSWAQARGGGRVCGILPAALWHRLPEDTERSKLSVLRFSPKGKSNLPSMVLGTQGSPWAAVPNPMLSPTPCSLLPGVSSCASSPLSCGAGACVLTPEGYSCLCHPGYTLDPSRLRCTGRLAPPLPARTQWNIRSFRLLGGRFSGSSAEPLLTHRAMGLAGGCCGDCLSSFLAWAQMKTSA